MRMNRRQLLGAAASLPAAWQLRAEIRRGVPSARRPGGLFLPERTGREVHELRRPDPHDRGLGPRWVGLYRLLVSRHTRTSTWPLFARLAFKNGIQIYNAGVRAQLCQPTPELQLSQFENIKKWVDVADRLGASHVRVFGGQIPKGATEQQAIAWAVEVLKRGAEYAGGRGITLGVEDDGGLTTAAGPTVEIVKQAASPWAGINADSGNLRVDGYSQFATMLPYATSVHLKTTSRARTERRR